MRWLRAVIARLIGLLTRTRGTATALPTPAAGLAPLEHMMRLGSRTSAMESLPPLQLLAKAASPKKPKAARRTSAASKSTSKKPSVAQTEKSPSSRGNSTQTPASRTPQPALPESKPKPKRARPTKAASKPTPAKAPAKTRTARPSGVVGS